MFGALINKIHKNLGQSGLVVVLIILIFFTAKWTLEGPYFKNDSALITIPLENLYGNIQRSGQSPLWAPELAGGYPLLAIGQLGYWYPPHMILRQFFPAVITLNISLLLHTLLAALGVLFFLKHNKVGNTAATVASILFSLSPVFVARYEMLNLVLPFTWLPLILLLIQLCVENPTTKNIILLIVANIMCILVGHPQMTFYVLIAELLFIGCLFFCTPKRWTKIILAGICILIAIGLSAFSLLPIIGNLPNTDRANGSTDNPYEFQLTPSSLVGIIIAHPFGQDETYKGPKNESELASYLGPFAFIFSIIGLFTARKKFRLLYFTSIIFILTGLAIGLGELSPIYRWLINHGWNYFGSPARLYFFTHIGLVLLSTFGVDYLLFKFNSKTIPHFRIISFTLIAMATIPALLVSYSWTTNIPWKNSFTPKILRFIPNKYSNVRLASISNINQIDPSLNNDFGLKIWKPISSTSVFRQTFQSPYSQFRGIAIKLSVPRSGYGKLSLKIFSEDGQILRNSSIFATNFIADDWNNFNFEPVINSESRKYYFEITSDMPNDQAPLLYIHNNPDEQYDPNGELSACANDKCVPVTPKKIADIDYKIIPEKDPKAIGFETLSGHVPAGNKLGSTFWIGALPILNVSTFLSPIETESIETNNLWRLNRFASNYLLGIFPQQRFLNNKSFSLINSAPFNDQFIRLYKNNEAFPRMNFVQNAISTQSKDEQSYRLKNLSQQNQNTVIADIENDLSFDTGDAKANFIKDARTEIEIKTENSSEGFLVLRDVYLKGWQATIDGKPTKIYRTDSIFRGVLVPARNHTVLFEYKPDWIKTAIVIEVVSIVVFFGLLFFAHNQNRRLKNINNTP